MAPSTIVDRGACSRATAVIRGGVVRAVLAAALALSAIAGSAAEKFILQWRAATPEMPWLAEVNVRGWEGATVESRALPPQAGEYPHGMEIAVHAPGSAAGSVQVQLAGGYGFTVSEETLRAHPHVWAPELGIYLSRGGSWSQTAALRAAAAERARRSFSEPFQSTAERYAEWSGLTEHEPDDVHRLIWQFIAAKETWPEEARVRDRIAAMPEVDVPYFTARIPDLKYAKMFLGWPDHNDQFTLWNHGAFTVSSQSVGGNPKVANVPWHPRAEAYTVRIGAAATPSVPFREYGDTTIRQRLDDGHNLVVTSEWSEGAIAIAHTAFAAPLGSHEIRTGIEPMLLWSRVQVSTTAKQPGTAWLAIEFTDADFVTFYEKLPLPDIAKMEWRDGKFVIGDRVIAVSDPALAFHSVPTHGSVRRFRARVEVSPGQPRSFGLAFLYRPVAVAALQRDGVPVRGGIAEFNAARARMLGFWNDLAAGGANVRVPDEWLNNLYRTFLPRIAMNSHLDPQGMPVFHTGPVQYARVWHHITGLGIAGDLSRRGQFALARKHFEAIFKWQGIPPPDSQSIKDWSGFFGAPPEQCPMVWMSYQGMVLGAAARYFELSGDRAWLDEKLPALVRAMDWGVRTRSVTKVLNPDGSRPLNYGWMLPGRTSDSSSGSAIYSDSNLWLGLHRMAAVLKSIGHPRADEFQAEADDYRQCIQDGERRSAAMRPLRRLNDGTWVPYLPATLDSQGAEMDERSKYVNLSDCAWAWGILDTQVYPSSSPEARWVMALWDDSYTPMVPGLCDEPFTSGPMNFFLHEDRIENFLYAFYSQSTNTLDRETLTTFEHYGWGQKRAFELTGWAAGYWTANFTNMLCRTVGRELWLMQATPRRWLENGEEISVERLQTEFGPVSFKVRSELSRGRILAEVSPPQRNPIERLRLRLRVPKGLALQDVQVNGSPWRDFDAGGEWLNLPASTQPVQIEARFSRQ
jgi:hypothetical protein